VSASAVVAEASGLGGVFVSALTIYTVAWRPWRKRARSKIASEATEPFIVGEKALAEFKLALELKDARIHQLETDNATSQAKLREALAVQEQQQGQIMRLQAKLYEETSQRQQLQADMDVIKKKMSLGEF
jgi:hypothetical protein